MWRGRMKTPYRRVEIKETIIEEGNMKRPKSHTGVDCLKKYMI